MCFEIRYYFINSLDMRKSFTVLLMLFSIVLTAQNMDIPKEKDFLKLFIGVGASFSNGYEINDYLSKNGIQTLNPVEINANAGIIFFNDDVDIDLGYEMFASGNNNDETKNRLISNGVKLRAHYVIPIHKDIELGTGFTISYAKKKLAVFYTDYVLDFDNLPSGINGNQISLFIEKAYLGPSLSFKVRNTGRNNQQTKVTFSYEFPINNQPWKSDFSKFQNTIHESKRNQFVMNLTFVL